MSKRPDTDTNGLPRNPFVWNVGCHQDSNFIYFFPMIFCCRSLQIQRAEGGKHRKPCATPTVLVNHLWDHFWACYDSDVSSSRIRWAGKCWVETRFHPSFTLIAEKQCWFLSGLNIRIELQKQKYMFWCTMATKCCLQGWLHILMIFFWWPKISDGFVDECC